MFGESESESPRAGSPWDSLLLANSPKYGSTVVESAAKKAAYCIPKLSPEVEQGNVEYKLKLVNPTEERFARLVTQLKWRLLEGGGQAYYELGVADSGQLVGLTRLHLEQSLQTLEEMAGEIGASVVVVKEIEVPRCLLNISSTGNNKGPDGAMRMPKLRVESYADSTTGGESGTTGTDWEGDAELELASPSRGDDDGSEDDRGTLNIPVPHKSFRNSSFDTLTVPALVSLHTRSHPDRPNPHDSPAIRAIDSDVGDYADIELDASDTLMFPIDLAISSVYKPRPTRKRKPVDLGTLGNTHVQSNFVPPLGRKVSKQQKFQKKRRKGKNSSITLLDTKCSGTANSDFSTPELVIDSPSGQTSQDMSDLIPALESLHVSVDIRPQAKSAPPSDVHEPSSPGTDSAEGEDTEERRVMVEVLIVRKMSVEEAFLDFGGFSLVY